MVEFAGHMYGVPISLWLTWCLPDAPNCFLIQMETGDGGFPDFMDNIMFRADGSGRT